MNIEAKFQIGKNGVTDGFIETLKLGFKTHKQIRISVLRSAAPNKDKVKEMAEEIASKIGIKTKHRIIGFTIILRKSSQ